MISVEIGSGGSGVSPAIGVILMIAVTVAVVSIVSVVVFNMDNSVGDSSDVSVQVEETPFGVSATALRMNNADSVRVVGVYDDTVLDGSGDSDSLYGSGTYTVIVDNGDSTEVVSEEHSDSTFGKQRFNNVSDSDALIVDESFDSVYSVVSDPNGDSTELVKGSDYTVDDQLDTVLLDDAGSSNYSVGDTVDVVYDRNSSGGFSGSRVSWTVSSDAAWSSGSFDDSKVGSVLLDDPSITKGEFVGQVVSSDAGAVEYYEPTGALLVDAGSELKKYTVNGVSLIEEWSVSVPSSWISVGDNGQHVYSAGPDVKKIDMDTGNVEWTYSGFYPSTTTQGFEADEFGNAYIGGGYGGFQKINSDGSEAWSFNANGFERDVEIDSDKNVYLSDFDGYIYKFDSSGNMIWQRKFSQDISEMVLNPGDSALYAEGREPMVKLDTEDGSTIWQKSDNSYAVPDGMEIGVNNNVLVGTNNDRAVHSRSPSGEDLWSSESQSGNTGSVNDLAVSDDGYFMARGNGAGVEQHRYVYTGGYDSGVYEGRRTVNWTEFSIDIGNYDSVDHSVEFELQRRLGDSGFNTFETLEPSSEGKIDVDMSSGRLLNNNKREVSYPYATEVTSENLYVSTTDAEVIKYDKDSLNEKFQYSENDGEVYGLAIDENEEYGYSTDCSGNVHKFDLSTGSTVWNKSLASYCLYGIDLDDSGETLFVSGAWNTNQVHALNTEDGSVDWESDVPNVVNLEYHSGKLYTVGSYSTDNLRKFDADSGSENTSFRYSSSSSLYGIAVDESENVYVSGGWGSDSRVVKFDSSGSKQWIDDSDAFVHDVEVMPSGGIVATSDAGWSRLYNDTGDVKYQYDYYPEDNGWVQKISVGSDGSIYIPSPDNEILKQEPSFGVDAQDIRFNIDMETSDKTSTPVIDSVEVNGNMSEP